ncbi:acyl-CoA dehydrogenase [Sciscionella marina]|uniref:acyl-CoA dehydrogenase n=1 Tax=Sciscionella marina TaxID=508770 RepID=UPI0007C500BA|nr:acyl-CoA dehydrogenase [Sciscionella marina]
MRDDYMYPTHPVLDAIAEYAEELRRLETESIELRKLAPEIVKRFREIGVMRLLQPGRYGGMEADPRVFNEAMYAISRASSSAGWVTGVVGVHAWHIGLFDDRAQREVLGENPDTWLSSSYGPAGKAKRVKGGHVLTGRWGFSSGSDYCDWVFVGGLVTDEAGGPPEYRHFLLPRPDYEIVDVWHASGLVGTGSNDIVVSEQFVPDHRSLNVSDTMERNVPGKEINTSPIYNLPWFGVLLNSVVVPLIGMASTALDEALQIHRTKVSANPAMVPNDLTLTRFAEASGAVDLARDLLLRNLGDLYDTACAEQGPTLAQRMRGKRDHMVAVELAVSAVDKAYQSGGPRSIWNTSLIQQLWRDVHAGQHHAMNLPDGAYPVYGRYLLQGEAILPNIVGAF